MAPLLTLDNFSLSFLGAGGETTPVLSALNLEIEHGQTHALVGESGSGKSVTALSILRLLEETSEIQTSGSIRFEGRRSPHSINGPFAPSAATASP